MQRLKQLALGVPAGLLLYKAQQNLKHELIGREVAAAKVALNPKTVTHVQPAYEPVIDENAPAGSMEEWVQSGVQVSERRLLYVDLPYGVPSQDGIVDEAKTIAVFHLDTDTPAEIKEDLHPKSERVARKIVRYLEQCDNREKCVATLRDFQNQWEVEEFEKGELGHLRSSASALSTDPLVQELAEDLLAGAHHISLSLPWAYHEGPVQHGYVPPMGTALYAITPQAFLALTPIGTFSTTQCVGRSYDSKAYKDVKVSWQKGDAAYLYGLVDREDILLQTGYLRSFGEKKRSFQKPQGADDLQTRQEQWKSIRPDVYLTINSMIQERHADELWLDTLNSQMVNLTDELD